VRKNHMLSLGTGGSRYPQIAGDSVAHVVCAKSVRCARRRACGLSAACVAAAGGSGGQLVDLTQFDTTSRLKVCSTPV
jgi:hypothetical protein